MLKIRDIKAIDPGPRQLTLGFDTITPEERNAFVMVSFREQISAHGHVILIDFILFAAEQHKLSVPDILQSVFWLANERQLHFMIDGSTVSPKDARSILLKTSTEIILLIDNQKVEDSVFKDTLSFYKMLMPDKITGKNTGYDHEQYEFAMALIAIFQEWKAELKDVEPQARKPHFPGSQKIEKYMQYLKKLMAHQDTASIINNACNKKKAISNIKADIDALSMFYKLHAVRWKSFIRLTDELKLHLSELEQNPESFQEYQELISILKCPDPWDMIPKAERLSEKLEKNKKQIIQAKVRQLRIEAKSDIHAIVEEIGQFLDIRQSDMDFRNKCLYPFQTGLKQLERKNTLNGIDKLINSLKDIAYEIMSSKL